MYLRPVLEIKLQGGAATGRAGSATGATAMKGGFFGSRARGRIRAEGGRLVRHGPLNQRAYQKYVYNIAYSAYTRSTSPSRLSC